MFYYAINSVVFFNVLEWSNKPTDKAYVPENVSSCQACRPSDHFGHISQLYWINVIYFVYYV